MPKNWRKIIKEMLGKTPKETPEEAAERIVKECMPPRLSTQKCVPKTPQDQGG